MRKLMPGALAPGMKLVDAVEDAQGRRLLPAGMILTERQIRMLKIWGVPEVVVDISEETGPDGEAAAPDDAACLAPPQKDPYIPDEVREDFVLTNMSHPLILTLLQERVRRVSPEQSRKSEVSDAQRRALAASKLMDLTRMTKAADLIQSIKTLASPPDVYMRLLKVINNARSSAKDIADVIGSDQALTLRLLRLVNSSLYAFPAQIDTVSRAVTIVGTAQLCDLALATSMVKAFQNIPKQVVDVESFWRHSFSCAVVARTLAAHKREANVERLFVSGLLHDVGRLILFVHCGTQMFKVLTVSRITAKPLYEAETEVLPFDHAQVGMALLGAWNLPPCHREAVGFHHDPARSPKFPREAMIIHIADIITCAMKWGSSGQHKVPPLRTGVWETLGLSTDILQKLLEDAGPQVREAMGIILEE